MNQNFLKAAVVQAAPVLFNKAATTEKTVGLIQEAADNGADLILFPETFIPCYPRGFSFGMRVGSRSGDGRSLWERYFEESIDVPGPETEAIGVAAKAAGAYVGIGVTERDGGTLYCTLLYFGPDGSLLGKHRKIKPTGAERLIWGEDDGSTLITLDSDYGKIGGLICWENYMPLARMALYTQGIDIYLAPTADARDTWQSTMRHIAQEGRCYVLSSNQYVTKAMYPTDLPLGDELRIQPEVMSRGGSVIVSPLGHVIAGPLFDEEGILYADLDMHQVVRGKLDFDVTGHYSRPDLFTYRFNKPDNR
ncbi:MAG: carbon-nitrogen hydrolase family protein [Chloroflexota bacterium]